MKVSEIGEFGLIDLLAKMVKEQAEATPVWEHLLLGIGDDAAAWRTDSSVQLATVDSMVQDVHFVIGQTTWEELGWKALAVNLSDIAAMGGLPHYALVSLALPPETEADNILTLYKGMLGLAQKFGVALVGGNITRAPQIVIDVTVIGSTGREGNSLLRRSDAKPGDKIAVTGYLGGAAGGLEMLRKNMQLNPEAAVFLRKAFLKPNPRVNEGRVLVANGVKAGMDISDGLVSDLKHICEMSKVGAKIEAEKVPLHPQLKNVFGNRAVEMALTGGEDYELLFTAPAEIIEKVKATIGCPVTVVGEITADNAGKVTVLDRSGKELNFTKGGWAHF